jgi:hypothetical protein
MLRMRSVTSFLNFSWTAGGCNRRFKPCGSPSASPFFDLQRAREMKAAPGSCLMTGSEDGSGGARRWMDAGERARGREANGVEQ